MGHRNQDTARGIEIERDDESGAPRAYTLGTHTFMGIELLVEPGVVVPRQVTERVGVAASTVLKGFAQQEPSAQLRVVDMCSGSGNLACGLASAMPTCRVWSCDLMPECSALARRNVERLGLGEPVTVRTGDLFAALAGEELAGNVDVVVCAPPFISTGRLAKDRSYLLEHEPREAFDAGPYGLSIHQRVVAEASEFLRPGGYLIFEVGEGQSKQVIRLFERMGTYEAIEVVAQHDGLEVVVMARRKALV